MTNDSASLKKILIDLLCNQEILSAFPEMITAEYLKEHFNRNYLHLVVDKWGKTQERTKKLRLQKCETYGQCSLDYFLGDNPSCPLASIELRLDELTNKEIIELILSIPPRIMLRKVFYNYWQSQNIWEAINITSDLSLIKKIPRNNLEFMYHNGGRFPCHSHELYGRVIFPRYEDLIIGLIMTIIAGVIGGIATVEYQRWRDRKKDNLEELEQALSLLLFESELRYKMELLHEIEHQIDTIDFHDVQEKAIQLINSIRKKHGRDLPESLMKLKKDQDRHAKEILEYIRNNWDKKS